MNEGGTFCAGAGECFWPSFHIYLVSCASDLKSMLDSDGKRAQPNGNPMDSNMDNIAPMG